MSLRVVSSRSPVVQASGANAVVVSLGMVNGLLLARSLGPVERGMVASVVQPVNFVSAVSLLGIAEEAVRRKDGDSFLPRGLGTAGVVALACGALTFLMSGGALSSPYLRIIVALVPVSNAINQLYVARLRHASEYVEWNLLKLLAAVSPVAIFVAVLGVAGPSASGAIAAACGATFCVSAAAILRRRHWARSFLGKPGLLGPRQLMVAAPHLAISLQASLVARGDVLLLSLSGRHDVTGIYVVAATAAAPLQAVVAAVTSLAYSEGVRGRRLNIRSILIASAVGGVLIAVALELLLERVLGAEYAGSVRPGQLLLAAGIPAIYRQQKTSVMRADGRSRDAVLVEFLTAVATLVPLLFVVSSVTSTQAALISVAGYSLGALIARALTAKK